MSIDIEKAFFDKFGKTDAETQIEKDFLDGYEDGAYGDVLSDNHGQSDSRDEGYNKGVDDFLDD